MTIETALEMSNAHNKDNPMSDEIWALRILAGAYRREKQINQINSNKISPNCMKTVRIYSLYSKLNREAILPSYTVKVFSYADPLLCLRDAFRSTNCDNRPHSNSLCSTSAGDVMSLDGRFWLIEPVGFKELNLREFDTICDLTSRDTSFGYDDLKRSGLI